MCDSDAPFTGDIPWRKIICSLVNIHPDVTDATLVQEIGDMSVLLRKVVETNGSHIPTYAVLHRVCCSRLSEGLGVELDMDPPWSTNEDHLRSHNRVADLDRYYEHNKSLSFVVIREYFCCPWRARSLGAVPEHQNEKLVILSENLLQSLSKIQTDNKHSVMSYVELETHNEIARPHIWTYYSMSLIEEARLEAESKNREDAVHLQLFLEYFRDTKRSHHAELESLLSQGLINANFIGYLFVSFSMIIGFPNLIYGSIKGSR
jgi:hypothetical protein